MGTLAKAIDYGVNCIRWDPPAETPEFLYVMFWDILKGDSPSAKQAPNLHVFKVYQRPASPCVWEYWNPAYDWWVQVGVDANSTWIFLGDDNIRPNYYFVDTKAVSPPAEYELFTNDYQSPFRDWGYEGFAIIFWLSSILDLLPEFGLDAVPDVMIEIFPHDDGGFVLKLCSLTMLTNIKLRMP